MSGDEAMKWTGTKTQNYKVYEEERVNLKLQIKTVKSERLRGRKMERLRQRVKGTRMRRGEQSKLGNR